MPSVLESAWKRMREPGRNAGTTGWAFVEFQKIFDDACRRAPADHWIWDGIHPTYAAHQLMADEWVRAVEQLWPD